MTRRDPPFEPEDLSVLARRGLLSEPDIRELDLELRADAALEAGHVVGLDLDRVTGVRPGDEALIGRAAEAALARVHASGLAAEPAAPPVIPRKRRRLVASLLAAALVSITGMAAAMWAGVVPAPWRAAPAPPAEVESVARPAAARVSPAARAEAPKAEPASPAVDAGSSAAGSSRSAAGRSTPETTASALFKSANGARRAGDFARASRLYSDLIARHPASDEARLARVSLGKLLLAQGDPSQAEREFNEYLNDGRGQLAEEALVSRAQSLRKLGRAEDERRTWQRLLADHPDSVYAAEAKGRLEALRREATTPAR